MKLCYHCMTQIENEHGHSCPNCGKILKQESLSPKFLRPGTLLGGRFITGYPLGAGGFGNTYIGWNQVLLRKVAIKEFYPEQYVKRASDGLHIELTDQKQQPRFQNGLRQFLEEARSVAALQDIKGVVEISNFFEENGTGYIIMEYLEGMDVKTILKRSGNKKDYEWCRRVILTILDTLKEIHKRGVLHRDIAPDNIYVTKEGVIKLIDFGAAKHASALANTGAEIMLKVGYAPIEQYSRVAPQGPYTDIYAVAAVFYRMLTGQKPFPANERMKDDALITPSEMGIALPQQAEYGIMVCLNVQPEYRLQSAEEFMEVLDGKNFVPVYEPEWILPPVKEKKRFSQMPMAAKVSIGFAVLILSVLAITISIAVVRKNLNQTSELAESGGNGMVTLADYSGRQAEETVKELQALGLTKISLIYQINEEETDTVLSQTPQPGNMDKDGEVVLYLSGGNDLYTLDDYAGRSRDEIIAWFARYHFTIWENTCPGEKPVKAEYETGSEYPEQSGKITISYEYSDTYDKDVCFGQSIDSGVVCSGKDDILFQISAGKASDYETAIPELTGKTVQAAQETLRDAGLEGAFEICYQDESGRMLSAPDGTVTGQSPEAGCVYNELERKTYRYEGTKREDEKEETQMLLTVRKEKAKPASSKNAKETQPETVALEVSEMQPAAAGDAMME